MSPGFLSVVMPTHNRAERLERAAMSVLSQVGPEVELVIVDDASTDDTPRETDRLASDRRVKVVRNAKSLGPSGARNKGIAAARGDLLGFCDDDDALLPGAAAALVDRLEQDAVLAAVSSWHRVVHDASGRIVEFRGPSTACADQLCWFDLIGMPFGGVRRTLVSDGPLFDERLYTCEDWDLWLRCAEVSPVPIVPMVLYEYHQHGGSRVTDEHAGREEFLDKHTRSMTAACRIYHHAIIAGLTGGRPAIRRVLAAGFRTTPAAAAFATTVLATGSLASAAGIRRRDPGLAARVTAAVVKRRSLGSRSGNLVR